MRAAAHQAAGLLVLSATLLQLLPLCARAQYPAIPMREPGLQGDKRQAWEFHPTLTVEEVYTDNVRLSTKGTESSDWVTQVSPGFTLHRQGPRLRANLQYSPQLIYRARQETHDVHHYLAGYVSGEMVSQLLFVDAQAYMSRQNASLLAPQAESDVNRTGNRTSVRAYNVSPYLRHDFGTAARGELRYSRNLVEYGGNSVSNSEGDRVEGMLTSGPAYKRLTWDVAYVRDHIRYTETDQTIDIQRISGGARHLITPTAGILVRAGYESNNYLTVGPEPSGKFWSVGPEWTPTPRTRLAATTGRRFFGDTHSVDFSHRTRATVWKADYSEDITTGRGEIFIPTSFDTASYLDTLLLPRIPDAAARQSAVQTLMTQTGLPTSLSAPVNYISNLPYVQKRARASFALNGVRNTVLVHAYRQTRDVSAADAAILQAGAGDLSLSPRTVQIGGGALWSLRISPVTTSTVSVDVTRNEFPALSREDTITAVRLALVKRLQPRVSGSVAYRFLDNNSNQGTGSYRENSVAVALSIAF